MHPEATYPVHVLREHATELEAALSVCLADPGCRPVHRLRTETRRVEAQVLLLSQLPEMPEHQPQAESLRRALKRLRRAAGEIRDLDVQRKSLEAIQEVAEVTSESAGDRRLATSGTRSVRTGQQKKGSIERAEAIEEPVSAPEENVLHKAAGELSESLGQRREVAVKKLQTLLHKRQSKAAQAVEDLLSALEPAVDVPLPVEGLLQYAQAAFQRDGLLDEGAEAIDELDEDELHTLRKAAKRARYLAENLPESPAAAERATHYEALQQAGGEWHDALDLARAARRVLGKKHVLTASIVAQREAALSRYRAMLKAESQQSVVPPTSTGSKRRAGQNRQAAAASRAKAESAPRSARAMRSFTGSPR